MAKLKYAFDNKSRQPLTVRGAAKKKSHWIAIRNDKSDLRNQSPLAKVKVAKKIPLKFDTYMGDATYDLNAEWHSEKYELINPDTGKPDIIWEVAKIYIFITKLVLPTGYDIKVLCKPNTVVNNAQGEVNKPVATFYVETDIGPMVGTWTKYKHTPLCNIVGRKFR